MPAKGVEGQLRVTVDEIIRAQKAIELEEFAKNPLTKCVALLGHIDTLPGAIELIARVSESKKHYVDTHELAARAMHSDGVLLASSPYIPRGYIAAVDGDCNVLAVYKFEETEQ